MLEAGGCELNLDKIPDELSTAEERGAAGESLEESLKKLDERVFGPTCDFEKAKMPWLYLRMRLLKSMRTMIHGLVATLLHTDLPDVKSLVEHAIDDGDSSDDV